MAPDSSQDLLPSFQDTSFFLLVILQYFLFSQTVVFALCFFSQLPCNLLKPRRSLQKLTCINNLFIKNKAFFYHNSKRNSLQKLVLIHVAFLVPAHKTWWIYQKGLKAESMLVWALSWCWQNTVDFDGWLRAHSFFIDRNITVGSSYLMHEQDRDIWNGKPLIGRVLCNGVQWLCDTCRPITCLGPIAMTTVSHQEWTSSLPLWLEAALQLLAASEQFYPFPHPWEKN